MRILAQMNRGIAIFVLTLAVVMATGCRAWAAEEVNLDEDGLAAEGYDVVAFFDDQVVPGDAAFRHQYQGATYRFSSAQNLERFRADPAAYAPKYGGYCAYGVRVGKKFEIEPDAYSLHDGKLYFLLNAGTRVLWLEDLEENLSIAETIWPEIRPIPVEELDE